jgi:hypothetical protein
MRIQFVAAFVLVLGVGGHGAPGVLAVSEQTGTIVAGADCPQDFPSAASPDPRTTVVMCRLDNPRGLAFSRSALYVAEAGRGGLGVTPIQCFPGQAVGATRCYGPTGAISRLWNGVQDRVATGLPSHANLQGRQAIGPNDIAVVPATDATLGLHLPERPPDCHAGCAYVAIGLQQPPEYRERFSFLADFAKLVRLTPTGDWQHVADLGAYETAHDPDHEFYTPGKLDTNPYGLLAEPSGRAVLVTDAGGNSMLRVGTAGNVSPLETFDISTVAVFPPHPDDAVPTSVAVGPDGAYYVGDLTGFPPVEGAANIVRIGRAGEPPEVCLSGFTLIIDIAFDRLGHLYVLQYSGSLIRIDRETSVTPARADGRGICAAYAAGARTTIVSGLTNPTAVAIGPDGAAYISNRGIFPAIGAVTGQVIRVDQQFPPR